MNFLHPALLSALGLVGIPLLVHLIRRRRLRVVPWAAMEFLRQSQKKQRRRLRIEEIILLLLRMLIVTLAVLAFARPVLKALGIPLLTQNARVYAVIVLDTSYSMEAKSARDGKTSWQRAQAAADTVLNTILRSGDSVSVVLLSDKPRAEVEAPSYDLKAVSRRVKTLRTGDRATDYAAGAQVVDKLLKASRTPNKEVYWITDDQESAWGSSKRESAHDTWSSIARAARITWTSVGPGAGERDNLAVNPPALSRELVTPLLPVTIEAKIDNFGGMARRNLPVHLYVDGKRQETRQISLEPGRSAVATFQHTFGTPGPHTGSITLDAPPGDALTRDNTAPFALRCRERIRVLLQDPRPARDPAHSETYYLLTAMAPSGAAETFAPRLREAGSLNGANLRDFDVVVVAGVNALPPADRRLLSDYVRGGGGVLLFPGPETDPRRVNADWTAAGLLPASLGPRKSQGEEAALTLNPGTANHPAFAGFKNTSVIDLNTARFLTYFPLSPLSDPANPDAVRVMLRFSNGDPAFIERKVGAGRVVLAASSAGVTWNQLPLKPAYIPLVYQLLSDVGAGPTARRNLAQGDPLTLALPLTQANKPVRVIGPDNRTTSQNSVLSGAGVIFTYKETQLAGLYRAFVAGTDPNKTGEAFAVALPSGESNLKAADPRATVPTVGVPANRLLTAETPAQLAASVRTARYGSEVWRGFLYALFPLLFLEIWLAQRFGRRG